MSTVLSQWNLASEQTAASEILPCCGSTRWARELTLARPFHDTSKLFESSDRIWWELSRSDWDEAFRSHPRIGERKTPASATKQSAEWSRQEQAALGPSDAEVFNNLANANRRYEERFGRIFLVCATGKSAAEMLAILERRLENDPETELREAAEEQRQITQLRMRKWLSL